MSAPQTQNIAEAIELGARRAFVDGACNADPSFTPAFVSNDWNRGRKVLSSIERELNQCVAFSFSVAFVTMSGIAPLLLTLSELEKKGIPGKVLTTDYLSFSDPKALEKLDSFSNIEVRMNTEESSTEKSGFHTKGYLFERADGSYRVLVGSSNLTGNALSKNREWNIELSSLADGALVADLHSEFQELWASAFPLASQLETYRQLYSEKQEVLRRQRILPLEEAKLEPNGMQLSFVDNLDRLIGEGARRALLVSATGTGKTYASAFALRHLKPKRALFFLHREQVLRDAMDSYRKVFGDTKTLGLLSGNEKDFDSDILFATVQTLSKDSVLQRFKPDTFDIVVIDEVHRAGAESYKKITDYFDPKLYLGMTASPDRSDGFDIYGLFDNNIAQEIRLQQALENDLLCPFHYFGITDVQVNGDPIDEESAFSLLTSKNRVEHIVRQIELFGYSGDRVKGLMFCRTNDEARSLSGSLNACGYRTVALSGSDSQEKREQAIERLAADEGDPFYDERLDYILTVDIFNEGVDIPEVNQVVMLRPTESPIVFVQQLGRGLRKAEGKDYIVVIDFIGNYKNNFLIPIALSGDRSYNKDAIRKYLIEGERTIPGVSSVHFDRISRERIFSAIDKASIGMTLFKQSYFALKHKISRIPSMVDFYHYGELDPCLIVNKMRSYYRFLEKAESDFDLLLSEDEHLALEFFSKYLADGIRWQELEMVSQILDNGLAKRNIALEHTTEYETIPFDDASWTSAANVFEKRFMNSQSESKRYGSLALVESDDANGDILASDELLTMLENPDFATALYDIVDFGRLKYKEGGLPDQSGFALYRKYSRKDACRILNWEHDDSSTLYGYRIKYGTCPIFVTYNKADDISKSTQYEDRFISRSEFSWMTRSQVSLDSPDAQKLANAQRDGLRVYLFVKKSDGEGTDFYYMGRVTPTEPYQTEIVNDNGKRLPIVNFKLKLESPVREDIYDYFAG